MFDNLLKRLIGAPSLAPLAADDARLAMAALMVRVAKADYEYAPAEVAVINELLMERYNLNAEAAATLRTEAEAMEAKAPDTVRFTRLVKDSVPYEDRIAVAESLWKIVLADNHRDHEEDSFLRLVVHLLGVNDRDSALARQRVQANV